MAFNKLAGRKRRKMRIRKKVAGNTERPRLTVFRSARHIYAQVVDDTAGCTLVSISTLCEDMREAVAAAAKPPAPAPAPAAEPPAEGAEVDDAKAKKAKAKAAKAAAAKAKAERLAKTKTGIARKVGTLLASRCKEKQITKVVFDRNGFLFHGRIKALADAARKAGLDF
jgi:large subunit ribosomal protein L18